jgi:hypothetical protein
MDDPDQTPDVAEKAGDLTETGAEIETGTEVEPSQRICVARAKH